MVKFLLFLRYLIPILSLDRLTAQASEIGTSADLCRSKVEAYHKSAHAKIIEQAKAGLQAAQKLEPIKEKEVQMVKERQKRMISQNKLAVNPPTNTMLEQAAMTRQGHKLYFDADLYAKRMEELRQKTNANSGKS